MNKTAFPLASGLTIPLTSAPAASSELTRDGKPRQRRFVSRTAFTPEVRVQALRMIEQGKTQAETARELGIKEGTVGSWFRAARDAKDVQGPHVSAVRSDLLALLQSLQRRIALLDGERAALTKTLASVREALAL